MAVLKNQEGLQLLLHKWEEREKEPHFLDTSIGFTINDNIEEGFLF